MLKLKKEKILVSLIAIVMIALVVGNVYSLATDGNNTGIQLTSNTTGNSTNTNKANATANTDADVSAEVGATNSNSSNNTTNTNKASNNTAKNTNTKNTNSNSATSGLPYAGSNTSIIFIVIALGVSAAYAYKKVSDYNV